MDPVHYFAIYIKSVLFLICYCFIYFPLSFGTPRWKQFRRVEGLQGISVTYLRATTIPCASPSICGSRFDRDGVILMKLRGSPLRSIQEQIVQPDYRIQYRIVGKTVRVSVFFKSFE